MTFQLHFMVEGTPIGKGRPKFARRGNFVSTYTPTKTRNYEDIIKAAATEAMTEPPIETPLYTLQCLCQCLTPRNVKKTAW
jgi:Holliday junction resolvase RusA-like endonuclease